MAWLKWGGYQVVALEEYLACRREFRLLPPRTVVVTFDDGYLDNRTHALPILQRFGIGITVFLVTEAVGRTNTWAERSELSNRALLAWSDVQQLKKSGVRFGAHSRTHASLTRVPVETARQELEGSRRELEAQLSAPVRMFSYPYGEHNDVISRLAVEAGFDGCCSTRSGLNTMSTSVHQLRRIEVQGTDSLIDFALKLGRGVPRVGARERLRRRFAALHRSARVAGRS
jgi:peptidoglycan/xylan/chitin deacetylase (PgdA/CDA1 family)